MNKILRQKKLLISLTVSLLFNLILTLLQLKTFSSIHSNNIEIRNLKQEIQLTKEDLYLSNNDKAKLVKSYQISYPSDKFKLQSPLFEGKEITVREWSYKGGKILTERTIEILQENKNPIEVKIWDFIGIQPHIIFDLSGNSVPVNKNDTNNSLFRYVTAKKTILTRDYGELNLLRGITSNHSMYVQIIGDKVTGLFQESADYYMRVSTKDLEPVADTISFNF